MPTVLVIDMKENDKEISFELSENEVIYEGLDRQGLQLPHGCLSGSCGACRIEILEGENNLKAPSIIEADTIAHIKEALANNSSNPIYLQKNIRLSCRARVSGDIKITKVK